MNRVKVFSDVDSVIVLSEEDADHVEGLTTGEVSFVSVNTFGNTVKTVRELWWHEEIVNFFRSTPAEIWWLTGWREDATKLLDPLWNVTSAGWVNWDKEALSRSEVEKKHALLNQMKDDDSPFIWIDDIAISSITDSPEDDIFWSDRCLLIIPEQGVGLTSSHVKLMEEFINAHR